MDKNELTIVFYEHPIAWEDPEHNYGLVESAFQNLPVRADILVVPETFTTGFSDNMAAMAEEPEGRTFRFAQQMARQYDALFVGTWTVRTDAGVFNRLHWVRPDGTYGFYDKAHTFRVSSEASQIDRGRRREIFEWRGWRIKPAVCYDLRFPKWLRNSNPFDYDLLLLCANWPASRREAWSTLLRARAIENEAYVVGVNRTGVDAYGSAYSGDSAAINYKGMQIDEVVGSNLRVATLELDRLQEFRKKWPFNLDFD